MINNDDEMYEALKLLTTDKKLRKKYAEAIYKTVNSKFVWSETSKKVLTDICNKKSK